MKNDLHHLRRIGLSLRLRWYLAYTAFVVTALGTTATRADPGDFQAMPGLWKIVSTSIHHGKPGPPTVAWRCVFEGADPWVEFADRTVLQQTQCKRSEEHRRSTALDWSLSCPGSTVPTGKGRVDFDSSQHFTASLVMAGQGEVVRVEGKRYAACTSPRD